MPRLIDADALICSECGSCDGYCDSCDGIACLQCISHNKCQLREAIDNAPAIDAEPVRHGRWVKTKYDDYVCSLCGEEAPNDGYDCGAKYCYECGAKMDAKE